MLEMMEVLGVDGVLAFSVGRVVVLWVVSVGLARCSADSVVFLQGW